MNDCLETQVADGFLVHSVTPTRAISLVSLLSQSTVLLVQTGYQGPPPPPKTRKKKKKKRKKKKKKPNTKKK
jgi:hypothetical protein